jgi:predicted helicase
MDTVRVKIRAFSTNSCRANMFIDFHFLYSLQMLPFEQVLQKYRDTSVSERHKGYRFERLMQSFLYTFPLYEGKFSSIWLWNEFPSREDFFLSTSGKSFYDAFEAKKKVNFAYRLWIDTTKKGFNREADNTIQGQTPEVGRLGYYELTSAAVDWLKLDCHCASS